MRFENGLFTPAAERSRCFFGMLLAVRYITALRVLFESNEPHKIEEEKEI